MTGVPPRGSGHENVWRPYTQMLGASRPPEVVGADGVRLHLADGRTLIDGIASWWTMCHGYGHPAIKAAISQQLDRFPHVMFGGLTHAPAEQLASRLAALLPGDLDHVFFTDSGSVAVEVALKMSVQYWLNRGVEGRTRFVAFDGGYHGDTLGAMSVTDRAGGMHARLSSYVPENIFFPTADALEQFLAHDASAIAAVILEPLVQGAGGMRFHTAETLSRIAELCRRHGLLLILDEIMTGFGRTGTMFACEQAAVIPDIICLSKALTGGTLPLAATVAREHVYEAFLSDDPGMALMHGPTFMANPLACAAANASLDLYGSEPRLLQVAQIERALALGLEPCRSIRGVIDVRVKGAIGVVQLGNAVPAARLRNAFVERGVWLRPFGDIVYLTPAFTITPVELQTLCDAVVEVIGAEADDLSLAHGSGTP